MRPWAAIHAAPRHSDNGAHDEPAVWERLVMGTMQYSVVLYGHRSLDLCANIPPPTLSVQARARP